MKNCSLLLLVLVLLISCEQGKKAHNEIPDKKELLEVDRAFSKLSEEKGMKYAFIEYIDSNGVLLRPYQMPIVGANAIDFLIQLSDTGYTLTWEPNGGDISSSGDLGYTFGIYAMKLSGRDSTIYGTYTSIWKKEKNGKWKFVLDTGNEGIRLQKKDMEN